MAVFPFFVVFAIALIIGFEFLFGTLQLQSSLRAGGSSLLISSHDEMDVMMNGTMETLLIRLQDRNEERLISLEKRLASLESTLRSHNIDTDKVTIPTHNAKASNSDQVNHKFAHFEPRGPFCVTWEENMDQW